MYGSRAYGTSSYGSIAKEVPKVVVTPDALSIGASLKDPGLAVTEVVNNLEVGATLHAPVVTTANYAITIKVNGNDISDQIFYPSLVVLNNLYSDPDTANFEILNPGGKTYTPQAGDEIEIIDTLTTIFKGVLIRSTKKMMGFTESYLLEFKDWTEELGSILVDETYNNEAVEDIIADIFTDSDLSDYDGVTNVSDTTVINNIVLDNVSVVEALDRLAALSGKHWYVDPEKDIYFFADAGISAPFNLTDTNGNYNYKSLFEDEDLTQLRNKVTVKGNGIAAVTVQDATSISNYGLREFFNRDNEITATNEATQKANAYLDEYKDPIKIITFETCKAGLYAGQQITIQSTLRGIDETLNIQNVRFQSREPNRFIYKVKATSAKISGVDDLFAKQENEPANTPAIQDQSSLQDIEFTAIDDETIQWSSGTIRMADGSTYSISADASETLTADHIIYFDKNVSTTVLQISTNFANGIGEGKIPLCYATKSAVATKGADIFPVTFGGKIQIDGGTHITDKSIITDNIAANAITANEISANTITATQIAANTITATQIAASTITVTEISVAQLSGISADFGTMTSGTVTGATIQTASSGRRTVLTAGTSIDFYGTSDKEGFISVDSSGRMLIDADTTIFIISDGSGDDIRIEADDQMQIVGGEINLESSGDTNIFCDNWRPYYNDDDDGSDCFWSSGSSPNLRMKLTSEGEVTADGSFTGGGADFAEMFESIDGKKINNGVCVLLEKDKIRSAKKGEQPVGVISSNPTIIGNMGGADADYNWSGKYLKDAFGNYIMEKAKKWYKKETKVELTERKKPKTRYIKKTNWLDKEKSPNGAKIKTIERRKVNPKWDDKKKYVSRIDRDEWHIVGLVGRVRILKGQPTGENWIKLKTISKDVEEWLIK